jgi:hypothetical protein
MIVEQSQDHGHEAQYSAVHIIATVQCRLQRRTPHRDRFSILATGCNRPLPDSSPASDSGPRSAPDTRA